MIPSRTYLPKKKKILQKNVKGWLEVQKMERFVMVYLKFCKIKKIIRRMFPVVEA